MKFHYQLAGLLHLMKIYKMLPEMLKIRYLEIHHHQMLKLYIYYKNN
jgi:hypothetical protein